jgi:hypothetical protein
MAWRHVYPTVLTGRIDKRGNLTNSCLLADISISCFLTLQCPVFFAVYLAANIFTVMALNLSEIQDDVIHWDFQVTRVYSARVFKRERVRKISSPEITCIGFLFYKMFYYQYFVTKTYNSSVFVHLSDCHSNEQTSPASQDVRIPFYILGTVLVKSYST